MRFLTIFLNFSKILDLILVPCYTYNIIVFCLSEKRLLSLFKTLTCNIYENYLNHVIIIQDSIRFFSTLLKLLKSEQ